jgi:hypothetical protein
MNLQSAPVTSPPGCYIVMHKGRGAPRHAVEGEMVNDQAKDNDHAKPHEDEPKAPGQPDTSVILRSGGFHTKYTIQNFMQLRRVDLGSVDV